MHSSSNNFYKQRKYYTHINITNTIQFKIINIYDKACANRPTSYNFKLTCIVKLNMSYVYSN